MPSRRRSATGPSGPMMRTASSRRCSARPTATSPMSTAWGRRRKGRSSRSSGAFSPPRPTDRCATHGARSPDRCATQAHGLPTDADPGSEALTVPTVPPGTTALLPPDELPRHVAIIMDGNRRWARQRDLPELDGHAAGVEAIRNLLRHAVRRSVPVMTLYAFSRENWARSDDEVIGLFDILEQ